MSRKPSERLAKYRRQRRPNGNDIAFVEIDGQRHYLGAYGSPESKEQYHKLLAEHAVGRVALPVSDGITITKSSLDIGRTRRTTTRKHRPNSIGFVPSVAY